MDNDDGLHCLNIDTATGRPVVMTTVSVAEAKQQFFALLARVEAGEEVVVARHGKPVIALVLVRRTTDRVLGQARDLIWVADDFDETPPDEIALWYDGGPE